MLDPVMFNNLRRYRAGVYGAFGAGRDALSELLDVATVAGLVASLAHLRLTAVHRRRTGSRCDVLAVGTMDAPRRGSWWGSSLWTAGSRSDTNVWPRDDAEASPARRY